MADWWVSYVSLGITAVAVLVALLVRLPVVPRSRVADLMAALKEERDISASLRTEIVSLKQDIVEHEAGAKEAATRINVLMYDKEWWRNRYEEALRDKYKDSPGC